MLKIETWNTGRGYTAEGQIVFAARKDGRIIFVDVSRSISGSIFDLGAEFGTLQQLVMAAYDHCNYEGNSYSGTMTLLCPHLCAGCGSSARLTLCDGVVQCAVCERVISEPEGYSERMDIKLSMARTLLAETAAHMGFVLSQTAPATQQQARSIGACTAADRAELAACAMSMMLSATVESLNKGEYVKRTATAVKTYRKGAYDRTTKRYSLEDCDNMNREVFVKRGTVLFYGFTY